MLLSIQFVIFIIYLALFDPFVQEKNVLESNPDDSK